MKPIKAWAVLSPRVLDGYSFQNTPESPAYDMPAVFCTKYDANRFIADFVAMRGDYPIVRVEIREVPLKGKAAKR